jgi:HEPN domain-containing protein
LSPSPEQVEYAEMLKRRAAGDLYVCRALAEDSEVDDNIIGFHAQQTVEKALKIALVLADIELPHTHDLESLAELVRESSTELPAEIEGTEWLTPWAADLRYEEPVPLDRNAALTAATNADRWAASLLAQAD